MKGQVGGRLGKATLHKAIREGPSEEVRVHRGGPEVPRGEAICPRPCRW